MFQPTIHKSYLVELNLPTISVGQRYTFADVPQLRAPNVFINGIEAFTADQLLTSPNQAPVILGSAGANFVLTLTVGEDEEIYRIPYNTLVAQLNGGLIRTFANKQINLVKSYAVALNTNSTNAGDSLIFNFYYRQAR